MDNEKLKIFFISNILGMLSGGVILLLIKLFKECI